MLALKFVVVGLAGTGAVLLAATAAAWRRACVSITRHILGVGPQKNIKSDDVRHFTPSFVATRNNAAVMLLLLFGLLTGGLFGWKLGIAAAVGGYVLGELGGFLFPGATNSYYVRQVVHDLQVRRAMFEQFNDTQGVARMDDRLEMLEADFGHLLE